MSMTQTVELGQRVADAREWLHEFLGEDTGGVVRLAIATGQGYPAVYRWRELPAFSIERSPFEGRDHGEMLDVLGQSMVTAADKGSDVFACPYPHDGRRRRGGAVERRHVHADIDGPANLDLVRDLGGVAVASGNLAFDGTPRSHVYLRLTESVSVGEHEALCRGFGQLVGGDAADLSKTADHDVLRPPGTLNHKRTEPRPVSWLIRPGAVKPWAPHRLAALLGQLDWPVTREWTEPPNGEPTGLAYGRVLGALHAAGRPVVVKSATEATASCPGPAHLNGDLHPSLSVRATVGRALVHCFAGCAPGDLLAPLGMTTADLFDPLDLLIVINNDDMPDNDEDES